MNWNRSFSVWIVIFGNQDERSWFCITAAHFPSNTIQINGVFNSTGGSVVEFSPATREARVRFPASAKENISFLKTHNSVLQLN